MQVIILLLKGNKGERMLLRNTLRTHRLGNPVEKRRSPESVA